MVDDVHRDLEAEAGDYLSICMYVCMYVCMCFSELLCQVTAAMQWGTVGFQQDEQDRPLFGAIILHTAMHCCVQYRDYICIVDCIP